MEHRPSRRDQTLLEKEVEELHEKMRSFNPEGCSRPRRYWRSDMARLELATEDRLGRVYDKLDQVKKQLKELDKKWHRSRIMVGMIILRRTGRSIVIPKRIMEEPVL